MEYLVIGPDGKDNGPYTIEQLRVFALDGHLKPNAQVKNFQSGQVMEASALPGVFQNPAPSAPAGNWAQPPSPYPRQTTQESDGQSELWRSIIWATLGLVSFFLIGGLGFIFGGYAFYYSIQCKQKGNRFGVLAIAFSSIALLVIVVGWIFRYTRIGS